MTRRVAWVWVSALVGFGCATSAGTGAPRDASADVPIDAMIDSGRDDHDGADATDESPAPVETDGLKCVQTNDCAGCCHGLHPSGFAKLDDGFLACACKVDLCKSKCPLFCDGIQDPQVDCQDCLKNAGASDGGGCLLESDLACKKAPDCAAYRECMTYCPP